MTREVGKVCHATQVNRILPTTLKEGEDIRIQLYTADTGKVTNFLKSTLPSWTRLLVFY